MEKEENKMYTHKTSALLSRSFFLHRSKTDHHYNTMMQRLKGLYSVKKIQKEHVTIFSTRFFLFRFFYFARYMHG
jgi:hypothetical protein